MIAFSQIGKVIIDCEDCKTKIICLTPNHKRCRECAYNKVLERSRDQMANLSPETKRQRFKDWYYQNIEKARKVRLEHYHKKKKTTGGRSPMVSS